MSAFMVSRKHIAYLVEASYRLDDWRNPGERNEKKLAKLGQMLWDENLKSVSCRYPNSPVSVLPGPTGETYEYGEHIDPRHLRYDPVQVIKSADCYSHGADGRTFVLRLVRGPESGRGRSPARAVGHRAAAERAAQMVRKAA